MPFYPEDRESTSLQIVVHLTAKIHGVKFQTKDVWIFVLAVFMGVNVFENEFWRMFGARRDQVVGG
jgi:hypothetical protein